MTAIRALLARFLPQGAVLLAVLTFASYFAGLLRDRIFARTFGAGCSSRRPPSSSSHTGSTRKTAPGTSSSSGSCSSPR